jgi:hypothetical protein
MAAVCGAKNGCSIMSNGSVGEFENCASCIEADLPAVVTI